jgi:isopenicillin-N N-acyltransferase-like protein
MSSLTLIEIAGAPRERGRQYGEQAREQIASSIAFYSDAFAKTSGRSWQDICDFAENWREVAEKHAPDLVDEARGIAEGAGVGFSEIMAINARGEILYGEEFQDLQGGECSAYSLTDGAAGDGHVYSGQNWDYLTGTMDSLVMLRVLAPGKPALIMEVEAGQVGRHGANSAGLSVFTNGLGGRYGYTSTGLPQPFIRRRLLESPTMHDMIKTLYELKPQISTNYVLTARDDFAIDFEVTAGRTLEWLYPTGGVLVHGNHHQGRLPFAPHEEYRPLAYCSFYRVPRIEKVLRTARAATGTEQVREVIGRALSDDFSSPRAVGSPADPTMPAHRRWQTVMSSIVDHTTGDFFVCPGIPSEKAYERLPWNIYDTEPAAAVA